MKKYLAIIAVLGLLLIPLYNFAQVVDPKIDNFWVAFDEFGMIIPSASGGTMDDQFEDGTWYEYIEWWNIWFYDHPLDDDRYKEIYMEFYLYPIDPFEPVNIEIVANWSTQFWEQGGPPPLPPMTLEEENIVITRSETIFIVEGLMIGPGEFIFYQMPSNLIIPLYNPEWVSVDIRGSNFQIFAPDIVAGQWSEIVHWCLPKEPPFPDVEMGDAPEEVLAYIPSTLGHFPTCLLNGPYISHITPGTAWFGGYVDAESNGNSGSCDPYTIPYDNDECGNNPTFDPTLDEGLLFPSPFTIIGSSGNENYQPCTGVNDTLAPPCTYILWGQDIDIWVQTTTDVYINVLFDWDQDGYWGGTSSCQSLDVNEHVLHNFLIPAGTNGPLSGVYNITPGFNTGPNEGYTWARFSLTDEPVLFDWDGHGLFGDGETEDYLLLIATPNPPNPDGVDMGDAPENDEDGDDNVLAYIPSTLGHFPTCINSGTPTSYISHAIPTASWFGGMVDAEGDGNTNICDPYTFPYNNDECGTYPYPGVPPPSMDEGLMFPSPYTIIGPSGNETYQPCSGIYDTLAPPCTNIVWGQDIDIWINTSTDVYLNVLFDWDQDGDWGGTAVCPLWNTNEHVLNNLVIPAATNGPLSSVPGINPGFFTGPKEGYVWARFSLTEQAVSDDWDGHGQFQNGETEDYLLFIATPADTIPLNTVIQNVTINGSQVECYNATNNIVVAGSGTSVDVLSGGEATFIAGNKISFEPGFTAHNGSYCHAYITETGNYCSPPPPLAVVQDLKEEGISEKDLVIFDELLVDNDIHIDLYPNPTSGLFTIDFKDIATTADILLLNSQGIIALETSSKNQSKKIINISHLHGGMYIVVIKSQKHIFIKKIIKN